jgi:uroporphyrinogen-III synthase
MAGALARAKLQNENARLVEETQEMKRQLETRKLVERAKGILQFKFNLTEEEAYLRLRNESRRLRRPMRDLAEAIILTEDLSRKTSDGIMVDRDVEGD